jgi:acyl-CoA synthetase (AMP-forming)/AMP-acid ligase II/acyl carrier protein
VTGREGTLHALLEAQARRTPAAIAILAPGRAPLTYGRLHAEVIAAARALEGLGLGPGDRVASALEAGPEAAIVFLGVTAIATFTALHPAALDGEVAFALEDLEIKALIVPVGSAGPARVAARDKGVPVIEIAPAGAESLVFTLAGEAHAPRGEARGLAGPDDEAMVLHTSGTTAKPKIVPLLQRNLYAAARAMAEALALTPSDRCLNVMPLFHIHGLSTVYGSIAAGASVACPPAFDPEAFLSWVEELAPTWTTAAPTIHYAIREAVKARPEVIARRRFRFLRSASAPMPPALITDLEELFGAPFVEAYGMTEACPPITNNRLPPGERKLGSVGPAVPGTEVVILDEGGRRLAAREVGEVAVRGPSVMSGYARGPRDGEHDGAAALADGLFRTGDQGYLDEHGYLFITGRLKEIINRGGEKVAPREVDEALLAHPAVAEAVAFAMPHPRLGEDVAAAVVLRAGHEASPRALQAFVGDRLAAFKVPRVIVGVPAIPRGATGKLQRRGLAEALGLTARARVAGASAAVLTSEAAPRSDMEARLMELFAEFLGAPEVGPDDDFFRLGGDSLLGLRVLSRLREETGVTLAMRDLFLAPTSAELAARALAASPEASAQGWQGSAPIPPLTPGATAPLSFAQESFWFLDQIDPRNAAYNVYRAVHLEGPLEPARLEHALAAIVRRHAALRTTFPTIDGEPRRAETPAEEASVALSRVDLCALPVDARLTEAERLAAEEAARPFDLARGPLFRATLLTLDPAVHVLVITAHHAVIDLWSVGVLFRELGVLYASSVRGEMAKLPELPIQHGDFAAFQRRQAPHFAEHLAYWKAQLEGLPPPLDLPTDRPRAEARTSRGARRFFDLPKATATALRAHCRREGLTLFTALLAAFQMLLARVTGQRDVIVGSPIVGRGRPELEGLIGIFSNTLVFRGDLTDDPSFRRVTGRAREAVVCAFAHQDLPFDKLVEGVRPADNRARMPLFQVNFRVQRDAVAADALPGLRARFLKIANGMAKFDLALEFSEASDGISGFIEYRTELFEAATIDRLLADLLTLLAAVTADPDVKLSALALATTPRAAAAKAEAAPPRRPEAPKLPSLREARRRAVDLSQENDAGELARADAGPARKPPS